MRTGQKAKPRAAKYDPIHYVNSGDYSTLTEMLSMQIVDEAEQGLNNAEIIAKHGIPEQTFYTWHSRNTNSLKDKLGEARRRYMLNESEQILSKLIHSKNERIVLEATKYLSERLGKKNYANKEQHELLQDNEGTQLEPENKDKLDALLGQKSLIIKDIPSILF